MHSRTKTYEIQSLTVGPLSFSDNASKALASVSDRLLFIVPAHQHRPLQILEIPLVANMDYVRSDGSVVDDDKPGEKAELRLQLQNTGFYILNGFKSAIDQIHLSFATRDDCGSFCHAMAHSLQNIPNGLLTHALGESHVDSDTGKSRPRKQSHAVMIDLSQDIVISGVSQLMSPPVKEARRVSTSGLIDVSRSTESFTSHSSPPEEIKEQEAVSLQPEGNEEYPLGSRRVQENSHDYNGAELISNADDHEKAKSVHQVRRVSDPDQLRGKPIAPAQSEAIGQEAFEEQTTGAHLPQRAHQPGFVEPNIRSPAANSSLQHLALEALQHSTPNQMTVVSTNTDSVIRSKEGRQNSRAVGSEDGAPRPAQPSSVLAKSARRKGSKPITAKQVASSAMSQIRGQLDQTKSETSKTLLKRPRAANATLYVTTTVDWDEDLRADPNGHEDQSNDTRRPKTGISRSATNRAKKSIGTKFGPKPSSSRRKGRATAKSKENKTQSASVNKGLAATRPRRAAAKVSYDERSQQEEQSQDIGRETKDTASQVETEKRPPVALSPHTFSDNTHGKIQLVDDRSLGDAADESRLGELHAPSPPLSRATVATSGSGEAHLSSVELQKERQNEGFEIDVPGSNSAPFCGGKDKTEVNRESPERTDLPDVEAVDDSHPLDNQQRMDAMKAARRSFGSTLMNVMNESGIQPGKTGSTVAKAKPFGDKAAFVDSVKTALNQSSSRHGTQGPSSDRKKHAQTPSRKKQVSEFTTSGGPASGLLHSARMNSQQTTKGSISRPQYDDRFTMATAAQLANAVKPIVAPMPSKSPRTSSPFLQQQRLTTDQTQPIVEIEGSQGDGTHNRPSNPPKSTERMRLSAETIWPAPSVPQTNAAASTLNNERKGGLASDGEEAPQVKRARRSGPSHEKPQVSDQSMSKIVLQAPPTGSTTVGATGNVSGISPRPEREPEEGIQIEAPAGIGIQQTQNPAQTVQRRRGRPRVRSSADALKSAQAKAHTPRRHVGLGPPTLEEDYLHRKAQIVGFSANGSRYQGGMSVGKQGPALAQSGCVPTETGKHLAFKKLHTESKAIQQPQKIVTKRSQLFTHEGKRTVQLSLSDTDDPICVEEGSAENVAPAPAFSYLENSKSASQTSKVDENGSPRLHLRKISFAQKGSSAIEVAREADESVGTSSVYESSDSEELQTNESAHFGLETAVHNYHTVNSQMTAMMKTARSRPSIGVGELLDRSFPQASNSIKTNAFKAAVLADTTEPLQASQKADSTTLLSHNRSLDRVIISRETIAGPVPVDRDGTPSFDIDRLNISIADERSNSSASARVRRLRSSTPCSSGGGAPRSADSPPSFHTRLGKMIMPPPPRKHMNKMETSNEYETGGCLLGEKSALMDAETTLVNGDASEGETNVASPHKQQGSSSSLSDEGDGGPTSSSPQAADQALHGGRRFWNHKVAETQQTVLEILEQVSEVSTQCHIVIQNDTNR